MTHKDAPYKPAQRVKSPARLLATSSELRDYQKEKGTSALHIARQAKAILADHAP